jgi:hypothetical protein
VELPTHGQHVAFIAGVLHVRATILIAFVALGATAGAVAALDEGWGLKVVFGCIGAVAGTAIGGAFAGIGLHRSAGREADARGLTDSQNARRKNYWLDRGRLTASPGLPHPDDSDPHSREP